MGTINILKNGYRGKLGATVGQQWNGQLTLRTYLEHNNSKTEAQLKQRETFKTLIDGAQQYYNQVFNYNPPRNFKGTKWNYLTKGLKYILEMSPQPGQVAKIYPDSKAGLLAPYQVLMDGKYYTVLINQNESSPYDYKSVRYYGMAIPGATPDVYKEAFAAATPTPIKATFPAPAAMGISGKTVLYEVPTPPNNNSFIIYGIVIRKGSQKVYTDSVFSLPGIQITPDQLIPW